MLIETFIPAPDAIETHKIEIAASREAVYQALWTTDLGGSPVIKGLMALRSLPGLLLQPGGGWPKNRVGKLCSESLGDSGGQPVIFSHLMRRAFSARRAEASPALFGILQFRRAIEGKPFCPRRRASFAAMRRADGSSALIGS